jgi:hypothetical protein
MLGDLADLVPPHHLAGLVLLDLVVRKTSHDQCEDEARLNLVRHVEEHLNVLTLRAGLRGPYWIGGTRFALVADGWSNSELAALCRGPIEPPSFALASGQTCQLAFRFAHGVRRPDEESAAFYTRVHGYKWSHQ